MMKNKFLLFITVLLIVLAVGGTGLFLIYGLGGASKGGYSGRSGGARDTSVSDAGGSVAGTSSDPGGLASPAEAKGVLDTIRSESFVPEKEEEILEEQEPAEDRGRYQDILDDPGRMERENIYSVEPASAEETVMDFTGDILFDPSYSVMSALISRGGDISAAFSDTVISELQSADITFMNNEFPYSDRGAPTPEKTFTFRARPSSVKYLTQLGVDAVSLANNHCFDYGEQGLLDTLDTLTGEGISYIGAGRDLDEAMREICFISNDTKIAVIAATQIERLDHPDTRGAAPGVSGVFRCLDPSRLIERVKQLDNENDVVIVFIHWGTESTTVLDWLQLDQVKKITAAGADVIVGAHPHVLQAFEYVNGVPVAYSLGNFWFNSKTLDTCIFQIRISEGGERIRTRVLPGLQSDKRVSLLEGPEKDRVLSYLNGLSSTARLDEDGYMTVK